MHEDSTALDMAQELEAEALALARAGDEAGHVGDRVARVARLDDAEVRHERRERVVRDLGACRGDRRDERGLAGARVPDERDVGDRLELEDDVRLLAGLAEEGEAGCLALRRRERHVAEAATAARRDDVLRAVTDEVREDVAVQVLHDRAVRDAQDQVLAVGPLAVVPHAHRALVGSAVRRVVVLEQGRHLSVDDQADGPAVATVGAVRAREGLELLSADRRTAVAAVTAEGVKDDAVDKAGHGGSSMLAVKIARGAHRTGTPLSKMI